MKRLITIYELIRKEGREPGGRSPVTAWAGEWGKPMRRQPDDGKPVTLLGLSKEYLSDDRFIQKLLADHGFEKDTPRWV